MQCNMLLNACLSVSLGPSCLRASDQTDTNKLGCGCPRCRNSRSIFLRQAGIRLPKSARVWLCPTPQLQVHLSASGEPGSDRFPFRCSTVQPQLQIHLPRARWDHSFVAAPSTTPKPGSDSHKSLTTKSPPRSRGRPNTSNVAPGRCFPCAWSLHACKVRMWGSRLPSWTVSFALTLECGRAAPS